MKMNTKMKGRLFSLVMCVLVAAASCAAVFAAGHTIVVEECDNLELTLPDNMTYVTRSSEPDDSYFSEHNVTYEEVQEAFDASDSYLQAMDDADKLTLTLSYLQTGARDFGDLSAAELSAISRGFIGGTDPDVQYISSTQDEAGHEMVWLFLNMSIGDNNSKGTTQYQATTVINGMNITLTLYRNGGNVKESDYDVLVEIARSVRPPQVFVLKRFLPYILIGVGLAALILILVLIVKNIKNGRESRDARAENDRILEELAIMYRQKRAVAQTRSASGSTAASGAGSSSAAPQQYEDIFANSADSKPAAQKPVKDVPVQQETEKKPAVKQAPVKKKRVDVDALLAEEFGDEESVNYDDDIPRKYSDEDIERLLS